MKGASGSELVRMAAGLDERRGGGADGAASVARWALPSSKNTPPPEAGSRATPQINKKAPALPATWAAGIAAVVAETGSSLGSSTASPRAHGRRERQRILDEIERHRRETRRLICKPCTAWPPKTARGSSSDCRHARRRGCSTYLSPSRNRMSRPPTRSCHTTSTPHALPQYLRKSRHGLRRQYEAAARSRRTRSSCWCDSCLRESVTVKRPRHAPDSRHCSRGSARRAPGSA